MLKIFIGYDPKENAAYHVCAESLRKHSSIPLAIMPLRQETLRKTGAYTRPVDEPASTEFAFTRFLVPFLCGFKDFAMFVDCDFLFTRDVAELLRQLPMPYRAPELDDLATGNKKPAWSVACVQHDYLPKAQWKMDGEKQVAYPRKNWSSLMIFNNLECTALSKNYVNSAPAADLHRFEWMKDNNQIAQIPQTWNWLEGEYEWDSITPPAAIHYTNGGVWHVDHRGVRFGDLWLKQYEELTGSKFERDHG